MRYIEKLIISIIFFFENPMKYRIVILENNRLNQRE
jgi:hypothetical protein